MSEKNTENLNLEEKSFLDDKSPFRNRILISMPSVDYGVFTKSIVYICAHSPAGAMGIVLNQQLPEINFYDLLEQLNLPKSEVKVNPVIHFGGPVEVGRGFVLHSTDFVCDDTLRLNEGMGVTGTIDILRAIATGKGPEKSIFALGYAGWDAGQLDEEIYNNNWLVAPADEDLIFNADVAGKWQKAISSIGVDQSLLSSQHGHS